MKKLLNKKGFTLMEMMIVVAIIVILVAIAVPSFNSSLQKANASTDTANFKAAKTAGALKAIDTPNGGTFYYDAAAGDLVNEVDGASKGLCKNHTDAHIVVTIDTDGSVTAAWSDGQTCGVDAEESTEE